MKKNWKILLAAMLLIGLLAAAAMGCADGVPDGLYLIDGNWQLYIGGQYAYWYTGLWNDPNLGWWLVGGGTVAMDYNGLWCDPNLGWWLVENGTISFGYTGLYEDASAGTWLIGGGQICFDYNGLWNDPAQGWCLVSGGAACPWYNGLYNDPNMGWWLIEDGKVNFGYTGLYYDWNYGWWLIGGGSIAFDYTGVWEDPVHGTWMIGGGQILWDFTGLWNDPARGWILISSGGIAGGYNGLYSDRNFGTWMVKDGKIDFGYSGLVYDAANPGWFLVWGGQIATGYEGLYNDATYGTWLIRGGRIDCETSGLYKDEQLGWVLLSAGELAADFTGLWNDPNFGWWAIKDGRINFDYSGLADIPGEGQCLIRGGKLDLSYSGLWEDPELGIWMIQGGRIAYDYTGYYDDARLGRKFIYQGRAEEWNDTFQKFYNTVLQHAEDAEENYTLYARQDIIEKLRERFPDENVTSTHMTELFSQSGLTLGTTYRVQGEKMTLDAEYYPGWKILQLYKQGRTDELSERERKVLSEAQKIAAGAYGTDLEKERYIYDVLCSRITYQSDDEPMNNDDTAIGALLNGKADCDGYSDAMVLCCGLAGIECRYVYGYAKSAYLEQAGEGAHMWNVIYLNGKWTMVDVTWGDYGDGQDNGYLFFNFGTDHASTAYIWDNDFLFTPVEPNSDFKKNLLGDQQPVTVASTKDVYNAVKKAFDAQPKRIAFYSTAGAIWDTDPTNFWSMVHAGGINTFNRKANGNMIELTSLGWMDDQPALIEVNTYEELYSAVKKQFSSKPGALAIYCPAGPMWAADPDAFWQAVQTGGADHFNYRSFDNMMLLTKIEWSADDLIFVDSDTELIKAVNNASKYYKPTLSIRMAPALANSLFANDFTGLKLVLNRSRLKNIHYSYATAKGAILLKECEFLDELKSLKEVKAYVRKELERKATSFTVLLGGGLTVSDVMAEVDKLAQSCGVQTREMENPSEVRFMFYNIKYYASFVLAEDRATALSYLKQAQREGRTEVRIYCSQGLFNTMNANNGQGFVNLLKEAGYTWYNASGNANFCLLYANSLRW